MAVNRGKQFEDQVKKSFEQVPHTSVFRLIDPQNGYAGVRNICDFIVYHRPFQYFIECKSVHGNTLSIHSNDPSKRYGMITNNQWEGLLKMSKIDGVVAGVIVWYVDQDLTMFYPIQLLSALRDKWGYKSVSYLLHKRVEIHAGKKTLVRDNKFYIIPGTKRRVLFDYDMAEFFKEVEISNE